MPGMKSLGENCKWIAHAARVLADDADNRFDVADPPSIADEKVIAEVRTILQGVLDVIGTSATVN